MDRKRRNDRFKKDFLKKTGVDLNKIDSGRTGGQQFNFNNNMTKENSIAELLERLNLEIQNPIDSVHKIVLKITIDNINKLLK